MAHTAALRCLEAVGTAGLHKRTSRVFGRQRAGTLSDADLRAKISPEPGTASPSLSLEDTSPPWSADAARPECGHYWRRPRDSEPPGHGAHPGPTCRAAETHSRNPSSPASLPWWSTPGTRPRRPRHPAALVRRDTATGRRE